MTKVSRDVLFERSIDLVVKQGEYVEQWTARQVNVQAGLAAAVGVVVAWKRLPLDRLISAVTLLLSLIAIILTLAVSGVIRRHLAWQSAYVASVKLIEGGMPILFRDNMLQRGASQVRIADFHAWTAYALCACWFVVGCVAAWFAVMG